MIETERYKTLMKNAMQCIHLARAINDRYPDAAKMPAEEVQNRKNLLAEASRLREIADAEAQQAGLEDWAAAPEASPVLSGMAQKGYTDAVAAGGRDRFGEANHERNVAMFAKALRGGVGALDLEEKAAIVEDATGLILVPHDISGPIFTTLPRLGVLRNLAFVQPTNRKIFDVRLLTGVTAGWGQLELGATPPTDAAVTPAGPTAVTVHDLVAQQKIGVDELADTDANLVGLIQEIVAAKFAEMEDDAFATGNGTSKPWGISLRASGTATIPAAQGVTAAASAVLPDNLKAMQYLISARFAANGVYLASDDATQAIALLKDSTSNYLWQPSNTAGQPDTLFGKPFYRVSGFPSMTASTGFVETSIMFGDVRAGYLVASRETLTVQRLDELYADAGQVAFNFRMRVGGDIIRPGAFSKYLL